MKIKQHNQQHIHHNQKPQKPEEANQTETKPPPDTGAQEASEPPSDTPERNIAHLPRDFSAFLEGMYLEAMLYLGAIPDPRTGETIEDL